MGLFSNLRLRRKLLIALCPLVLMVLAAVLYSSIQIKKIDTAYSELLSNDVSTLRELTEARSLGNRYWLVLYQQIAVSGKDRAHPELDDLDSIASSYQAKLDEVVAKSPELRPSIESVRIVFTHSVADSSDVREATVKNDYSRALQLMASKVDKEFSEQREALIRLADTQAERIDRHSDELTSYTHRTITITWIIIIVGLVVSFLFALYVIQTEVVDVVMSFRGRIMDVAENRLDKPIPDLERPNEIGEMSRALHALQHTAKERELQRWLKSEVAATAERLQTTTNEHSFAQILLSRISESIGLAYGAFYILDRETNRFRRAGAFASESSDGAMEFGPGEGLVGQAAAEKRTLEVSTSGTTQLKVPAGLGVLHPERLMFVPVLNSGTVTGVVELAAARAITEQQNALLEALLPTVALNLEILNGNLETRKLLQQTQVQAAGITATKSIRADSRFSKLPILAMTAHALVEERQRCLDAGMNDHITKPIDPDALFATLLRWAAPRPEATPVPRVRPPSAPGGDGVPNIEGVDSVNGLKRVAGNERLYRDLLHQFEIKQNDADQRIKTAFDAGDTKLAERIAHTVKGVAGNIGIITVHSCAERLERAIREHQPDVIGPLNDFSHALHDQIERIHAAMGPAATDLATSACAFSPERAARAVSTLRRLLESSDAGAADAYEATVQELARKVAREPLAALGAAITEFDFERALATLKQIAEASGLEDTNHDRS